MSSKSQHINYNAADLARYIAGEMNSDEMHRLEMQAMDDPFLADALDGYKEATIQYGSTHVISNIPGADRISDVQTRAVILPFYKKMMYAAAVIVIFSMGVFLFKSIHKDETQNTLTTVRKTTDTLANSPAYTPLEQSSVAVADDMGRSVATPPSSTKTLEAAKPETSHQMESFPVPKAREPEIAGQTESLNPDPDTTVMNSRVPAIAMNETLTRSEQEQVTIIDTEKFASVNKMSGGPMVQYKGKVTNRNHEPLQFATVELKNIRQHFLTDQEGKFNFYSRDTLLNAQIGLDGYQGKNITLKNNSENNQIVLNEVLTQNVRQKSTKTDRESSAAKSPLIRPAGAVPDGGWIAYERYIEQNKQPDNSNIHGEVELYFELSPSGKPIKIEVLKSLSGPLDKEAIRLIRQGPYWKSPPNTRTGARLTIAF